MSIRISTIGWFAALLFAATSRADLFINEVDYDQIGTDTGEWIEIAGTAGLSLDAYELAFNNGANGSEYATFDLDPANFTFSDETGTGWGFFVIGLSLAEYGVAPDYTPGTWSSDEIQNGAPDSIQLRLKAGPVNIHLIDYEGDNTFTTEDQVTALPDTNTNAQQSLYLTGTGNTFSDFSFSVTAGNGTPGALNMGQTLTAIPEPNAILFGGLICSIVSLAALRRRLICISESASNAA
jgi:uncharacterized protein